jgi:hypothetical protein
MRLSRKTSFIALLAVAVAATPPLGRPPAPAHGGTGPPLLQVAVLTESARMRRKTRFARVRTIRMWLLRRHRRAPSAIQPRGQSLYPPPPPHDSYARGPPRDASKTSCVRSRAA